MRYALLVLAFGFGAPALASSAAPKASPPGDGKDEMICRREVPVGSLIASRKICMTKTQWQKRADDGNAIARALVEDSAGACGHEICPF